MSTAPDDKHDLTWYLEEAVTEVDADAIGLAHNMGTATLDQLNEIVAFSEKLKVAALVEMWGRERQARGMDSSNLELPPEGYTGWRPTDCE